MMNLLPTRLPRKAFWIAVAVVVAILACVSVVLSCCGYVYDPDGMPRPDGMMVLQDPGRPPITYNAIPRRDGTILITRNGVAWITLANTKTAFLLTDPNGTRQTVVTFNHANSHGGHAEAVKVRAPVR